MKKQESVPKNKKKFKKAIVLIASILIFSVCFGIAQAVSGLLMQTSTQIPSGLSTPSFKLYFISITKSQLENSAYGLAGDYQKIGAGGYIIKNEGYYHVVSSCYEKQNDAILVQNNIKVNHNLETEIFSINFDSLSISGNFSAEEKQVLSKALKSFYNVYQSLFDIAISLDTNVYNDISARLQVNSIYSNFNSILTDFNTLFAQYNEKNINIINKYITKANEILEILCSGKLVNQNQTYSSLIKYRYLQFLSNYQEFLSSY